MLKGKRFLKYWGGLLGGLRGQDKGKKDVMDKRNAKTKDGYSFLSKNWSLSLFFLSIFSVPIFSILFFLFDIGKR